MQIARILLLRKVGKSCFIVLYYGRDRRKVHRPTWLFPQWMNVMTQACDVQIRVLSARLLSEDRKFRTLE